MAKITKPGHDPKTHRVVTSAVVTRTPVPPRTVMVDVQAPEQASAKKAPTPKQATAKKAPTPTTVKTLALRVNDEYAAWIEELRVLNRTTQAGLFDQALAAFAEMKGFRRPPERT